MPAKYNNKEIPNIKFCERHKEEGMVDVLEKINLEGKAKNKGVYEGICVFGHARVLTPSPN